VRSTPALLRDARMQASQICVRLSTAQSTRLRATREFFSPVTHFFSRENDGRSATLLQRHNYYSLAKYVSVCSTGDHVSKQWFPRAKLARYLQYAVLWALWWQGQSHRVYDDRRVRVCTIKLNMRGKREVLWTTELKTRTTRWQWLAILRIVGALRDRPRYQVRWRRRYVFIRPSIHCPLGPYWGPTIGSHIHIPTTHRLSSRPRLVYVEPAPDT
jgi:hypothetical protein